MAALKSLAHFPSMLHGSFYGVLDIESPADEFIKYFTRKREWKCYNHDSFSFSAVELRFKIESTDLEKRTVKMSIFWNHISDLFKKIEATFTITPTRDMIRSCLEWSIDFEKTSYDIVDPMWIVSTLLEYIRSTDVYNLYELNHKVNSIDTEYTADECFKAFIGASKDDAEVEIVAEDWENRTTTISVRSSHLLMTKYKKLKVTTTITPKEDYNNGSHVKWTIDSEGRPSDHIQDPDLFLHTAVSIFEDIRYKLPNKYVLSQELHLDIGPARFAFEIKLRKKPFDRFTYI
ncbi:hypothetical protein Bca52824_011963 [Brassica carinata]|uniref:Bet v I/Major latex protein domain-containing protein n=1 Tax=Brassica carinata TaxID=52824 RepID=A0A8X7VXR9_BRACI|nr:hypothetical protein Bca52824_011963 [Brassica carinata]